MSKRAQEHLDIIEAVTEAMFDLLGKKGVEEITVLELINKAGIARGTFYNNFESKDEVVIKYVDEVIAKFGDNIVDLSVDEYFEEKHIYEVLSYATNYEKHLKNMKKAGIDSIFLDRITDFLLKKLSKSEKDKIKIMGLAGFEYNIIFNWFLLDVENNRKTIKMMLEKYR